MTRRSVVVTAVLALVVVALGGYHERSRLRRAYERLTNDSGKVELRLRVKEKQAHPFHRPLASPAFLPAKEASYMRPDDPVVGIRANGKSWALPWFVLKNHHVANLDLDGAPWAITFCERCTGSAAYDPVVDGRRLHFEEIGVYRGVPLLTDLETGSYWEDFSGRAFRGPLSGKVLEQRPAIQSVWKDWLADNPDTLVVSGAGEPRDGHGSRDYPGDPFAGRGLGDTVLKLDDRLPPATLVLGVWDGNRARCYPLFELEAHAGVVPDLFEGRPIVALRRPGTLETSAFDTRLDGTQVELRFEGSALVDTRSGSHFTMFGEAVDGPLAGKHLTWVRSGMEEFNTWAANHPGATIFDWTPEKAVAAAAAAAAIPVPTPSDEHN